MPRAEFDAPGLIRVSGVTKSYGRLVALADVSFSIRPGEVLGLIGPNGAGKTTLFECLAGVLSRDSGVVTLDGRPLTARDLHAHLFYVPDGIAPWPAESVRWALEYVTGFFGGSTDRIEDVTRQLDLAAVLDGSIGTLSKGQRKRVALAVGMLTPQRVLLVDEPFDGLDLRQGRDAAAALRAHAATGRTLVLSIHQIADAARVCDRFVLLSGGRVKGEGGTAELAALAASRGQAPASHDLEEVFLALT
ncbi:MAG TPA: ABC transporter ATP-binding protein [Vicinamibacterales bacterium]|nr:ABC transporter ATP-binding protein [Vicinamibacterales bacterium]